MDFAKSQMEKHGWTEGRGLGRSEDGMKEAIKVKMKFDNAGVGHNAGDEFSFHWWDHMFNKALDNIDVENKKDGVKVKNGGDFSISDKKPFSKSIANKELLYGNFVKSSTSLTKSDENGLMEEVKEKNSSDSSSDEDDQAEPGMSFNNLTDDDLMKICGGRTAHKAARHGLKLNGKLRRIEEQEAIVLSRGNSEDGDSSSEDQMSEKKKKKNKKKKKKDLENCDNTNEVAIEEQECSSKKKKSKKRKKEKDASNSETVSEEANDCDEKPCKRKRSKKERDCDEVCDENDNIEHLQKKKSKKANNNVDCNSRDSLLVSPSENSDTPVKRKKSKKSKKSKGT